MKLADLLSPGLSLYCLLLRPLLVWPTSASADAAQDAPQMLYCDAKQQNLEKIAQQTDQKSTNMERPDHLPLVTVSVLEGGPDETVSKSILHRSFLFTFTFKKIKNPKPQKHLFCFAAKFTETW